MGRYADRMGVVALAVGVLWAAPARAEEGTLQEQVASLVQEFCQTGAARLGVAAVDLRSGQTILDIDAATPLIPASNQKLLTSAFALARLGKDFQFTTTVFRLGNDLLVVGDGDPTLGDPILAAAEGKTLYDELDRWAAEIMSKAGDKVSGDLILCPSVLRESSRHEDWPQAQRNQWYAAPVAGLNFNNNCFDITFTITGDQAVASVQPESRFIKVINSAKVGKRHTWSARSNEDDSVLTIAGEVASGGGKATSVAANNPPLLLGRTFADRLARCGAEMAGTIRTVAHDSVDWTKAEPIAQTTTPLAVAMSRANKRSLNMAAECLFLRSGDGTWDGSAALMIRTLQEAYGLDTTGLVVRDGGGLSRGNQVSPAMLASLLAAVCRRPDATIFLDSLSISGVDGTMRHRLASPPYRGRVLGKTGYIADVSVLSGYVLDEAGKPAIAFSILANDIPSAWKARSVQDTICRTLVDSLGAAASQPEGE